MLRPRLSRLGCSCCLNQQGSKPRWTRCSHSQQLARLVAAVWRQSNKHKNHSWAALQLPCSNLTALQSLIIFNAIVENSGINTHSTDSRSCALSFGGCSSNAAPHHDDVAAALPCAGLLPNLRHLELVSCKMFVKSFQQLSQVTSLSSLVLRRPQLMPIQNS